MPLCRSLVTVQMILDFTIIALAFALLIGALTSDKRASA